jgi:hypothetical protein
MRKLLLILSLLTTGCASITFELKPEGADTSIPINSQSPTPFTAAPLQYNLLADEGHLILWIENHTDTPIDLVAAQSTIEDSDGTVHPLRYQQIAPRSAIKMVLPPLADENPNQSNFQPPPNIPQPGNPYDQPGYIPVPNSGSIPTGPSWHWDDNSEIHLNLLFQQGEHQFHQHFDLRKVRK